MKAFDFSYGDKKLSDFDFIICRFDSGGLDTVSNGATITFNTIPTLNGAHHKLIGSAYEDCLETTIQICRNPCDGNDMEISPTTFRELTKWLCRKQFLKFKLLSEEYIDLYHEAVINVSRIELDGKLVGLELEIRTNRPFSLKEPQTINMVCEEGQEIYGWEKYNYGVESEVVKLGYVTSKDENAYPSGVHEDGYQYIYVGEVYRASMNDSSYEEGFIYPEMEITVKKDGNLKIHNSVENREMYIKNCVAGEIITLDYPVIKSSISSHNIQNDFNWIFFRVANTYDNSRNDLTISLPCSIKIKYSPIVKVGL